MNKNQEIKEKIKQLEQEKREQKQIIINLKNDKQRLEKQLIQTQSWGDLALAAPAHQAGSPILSLELAHKLNQFDHTIFRKSIVD